MLGPWQGWQSPGTRVWPLPSGCRTAGDESGPRRLRRGLSSCCSWAANKAWQGRMCRGLACPSPGLPARLRPTALARQADGFHTFPSLQLSCWPPALAALCRPSPRVPAVAGGRVWGGWRQPHSLVHTWKGAVARLSEGWSSVPRPLNVVTWTMYLSPGCRSLRRRKAGWEGVRWVTLGRPAGPAPACHPLTGRCTWPRCCSAPLCGLPGPPAGGWRHAPY